ncbi:MAG: NADH-quinone oxidoreductase subunit N, partial [Bacteroidales bacterium]|nr:NADH-quinone oxidoreductase subunit N [Bacteroidales bacterium]
MDFSQFLALHEEISLVAALVLLLVYDLFAPEKGRRHIPLVACLLLLAHTVFCACDFAASTGCPAAAGSRTAFAGMYDASQAALLFKNILNIGVLLVCLQACPFLRREDNGIKAGEFYFLLFSTLLGMYLMLSAGHFLLFFIGMETASIPMASLVAFDKHKTQSAEAGAKFILSSAFASGLSFFGLSLIYGGTGSLYFADIQSGLTATPLLLGGMVLLCSGLFFKISLVPYHLWAADVYEGAPTPVTTYLSVISKGAGVFALCLILTRAFPLFIQAWQTALYVLTFSYTQ